MFRFLHLVCFFLLSTIATQAADLVFVHCSSLSEKNIKEFQRISDQMTGVKFLGFCHDLAVVEFDIDRTVQPDNRILDNLFKKFSITDFTIQTPVEEERFLSGCKRFQPRN
ncbi:MAG: hypothetical protein ACKO1U_07645 [Bacteroidota bacterium]